MKNFGKSSTNQQGAQLRMASIAIALVFWSFALIALNNLLVTRIPPIVWQDNLEVDVPPLITSKSVERLESKLQQMEDKVDTLQKRFWLESLDPIFQYRPKYYLGKTADIEDKDQVIPYFLANFVNASDTDVYKRRIYIDLGLRDFNSSLCWMMQNYPVPFDFFYGFECTRDISANKEFFTDQIDRCLLGMPAGTHGYKVAEVMRSMNIYHNYVGAYDDQTTSPPTVGLSKFIKGADIRADDFVVLKMDVEGTEYEILETILDDGTYRLIDEVFVEIHYYHPEMARMAPLWNGFKRSRNDAQALFTRARDMGLFIHPWP